MKVLQIIIQIPLYFSNLFSFVKLQVQNFISANRNYKNSNHQENKGLINNVQNNFAQHIVMPDVELWLTAPGAKKTISGYIKSRNNMRIIPISIEIGSRVTKLPMNAFTSLPLNNLEHDPLIFTNQMPDFDVNVIFQTIDGKQWIYTQKMGQTKKGAHGFYNLNLNGPPIINASTNSLSTSQ